MQLYLAQHGAAASKAIDPERPLTDDGRAEVARVAARLAAVAVQPARICHSGKLRAAQSAQIFADALAAAEAAAIDGIAPNDPVDTFADMVSQWQADTLVVGHLPFMSRLVGYLLTADTGRTLLAWRPGSVVCLARDDTGHWLLQWMLRPEIVPD